MKNVGKILLLSVLMMSFFWSNPISLNPSAPASDTFKTNEDLPGRM